ncbi:MAG: YbhB/YbcL family Raf kinase inhibitor-like protein [Proteobacteria bacterium]|nr:YbhB/YbcL family Raf kinase inhibitor-like protein [Pseudomonadota bacterium]
MRRAAAAFAFGAFVSACAGGDELPSFEVTSLAFGDGETIPAKHTCQAEDRSPPLRFEGAPEETASYAIVMIQADEGADAVARWLLWGVAAEAAGIAGGVALGEEPAAGLSQGTNDLGVVGYSGPCPAEVEEGEPEDTATHRYVFRAYALSQPPAVDPGALAGQLLAAIDDLVIATGSLEGVWAAE